MDPLVIAPGAFGRLQQSRADGVRAAAGCCLLAQGHKVQSGGGPVRAMGLWSGPVQWPGAAIGWGWGSGAHRPPVAAQDGAGSPERCSGMQ